MTMKWYSKVLGLHPRCLLLLVLYFLSFPHSHSTSICSVCMLRFFLVPYFLIYYLQVLQCLLLRIILFFTFLSIQLHHYLRSTSFNNSAEEEISFDQNGELVGGFNILNWIMFPNQSFLRVNIGKTDTQESSGEILTIQEDAIVWPGIFNQVGLRCI